MTTRNIRLTSSDMVYTPGILRYFQTYFKSSPRLATKGFSETYSLPLPVTRKLLSGKLPYTVDDKEGTVSFSLAS